MFSSYLVIFVLLPASPARWRCHLLITVTEQLDEGGGRAEPEILMNLHCHHLTENNKSLGRSYQ